MCGDEYYGVLMQASQADWRLKPAIDAHMYMWLMVEGSREADIHMSEVRKLCARKAGMVPRDDAHFQELMSRHVGWEFQLGGKTRSSTNASQTAAPSSSGAASSAAPAASADSAASGTAAGSAGTPAKAADSKDDSSSRSDAKPPQDSKPTSSLVCHVCSIGEAAVGFSSTLIDCSLSLAGNVHLFHCAQCKKVVYCRFVS